MNELVTAQKGRQAVRKLLLHPELQNYTYELSRFMDFLEEEDLDLGIESIEAYLDGMECAPATYNKRLAAVRKIAYLVLAQLGNQYTADEHKQIREHLEGLEARKVQRTKAKTLTVEEYERLIAECPETSFTLIMELLYESAMRISEALGLKFSHLKKDGQYYTATVHGKGDKYREIPIRKDLVDRLRMHFGDPDYLIGLTDRKYVSKRISRIGYRILGKRVYPHLFRHSRLTHLMREHGRPVAIQKLAGHSDVAFTLRTYVGDEFTAAELYGGVV